MQEDKTLTTEILTLERLRFRARSVLDGFRNDGDQYYYEGSMNKVDDLRELVDELETEIMRRIKP